MYGDALKAQIIVLSTEGIVALQRISDFFAEVIGGLVSPRRATAEKTIEDLPSGYRRNSKKSGKRY
jgi:hypothetical protein